LSVVEFRCLANQWVSMFVPDEPASELLKLIVAEKDKIAEQTKSARATAKDTSRKAKSKINYPAAS